MLNAVTKKEIIIIISFYKFSLKLTHSIFLNHSVL
jgi:hypothetical protein